MNNKTKQLLESISILKDEIEKAKKRRKYSSKFEDEVRKIVNKLHMINARNEKLTTFSIYNTPEPITSDWIYEQRQNYFEEDYGEDFNYDDIHSDDIDEFDSLLYLMLDQILNECNQIVENIQIELKEFEDTSISKNTEKGKNFNQDNLQIFISHITEEAEYAKILKDFLLELDPSNIEVFISSDNKSINLGTKWFNEIENSISISGIMLVLCSEISVKSAWINFEAGAFWFKIKDRKPLIPVVLPGFAKGELPIPLSLLQAASIVNETDLKQLFKQIADIVNIDISMVNFSKLISKIHEVKPVYKDNLKKEFENKSLDLINEYKKPFHPREEVIEFMTNYSKGLFFKNFLDPSYYETPKSLQEQIRMATSGISRNRIFDIEVKREEDSYFIIYRLG